MATFDSAYLLSRFNRFAGRPTSGDSISDPEKYQYLTEAQNDLIAAIAAVCPHVLYPTAAYGSLPTMTTSDHQVFTFGTDANGYSITPIGKVQIYRSLNDIPTNPMVPGRDFLPDGGTAIRIPNNETYNGTLWWVGITNPPDITASTQPSLFPEASRMMIAVLAVKMFAERAATNSPLAASMALRLGYPFVPNYTTTGDFARWCTTWRTQFKGGGALRSFTGMDLALGSQYNWLT